MKKVLRLAGKRLKQLLERVDINGGLGLYKGGPIFIMQNAREAIAKAEGKS